jgi:WD40 repeat protein
MALSVSCPECGMAHKLAQTVAGKRVRCPKCQAVFAVPPARSRTQPTRSADEPAQKPSRLIWILGGSAVGLVVLLGVCSCIGFLGYRGYQAANPGSDWPVFNIPDTNASVRLPAVPKEQASWYPVPMAGQMWEDQHLSEKYTLTVEVMKAKDGRWMDVSTFRETVAANSQQLVVLGKTDKQSTTQLQGCEVVEVEATGKDNYHAVARYYLIQDADEWRIVGLQVRAINLRADDPRVIALFRSFDPGLGKPLPITYKPPEPLPLRADAVRRLDDPWSTEYPKVGAPWAHPGNQPGLRLLIQGVPVGAVALSPDDQLLAIAVNRGILVLETRDGKFKAGAPDQEAPIGSVAFSPDGKWLASSSGRNRRICIHQTGNFRRVADLVEPIKTDTGEAQVSAVAFSPDGNTIAAVIDGRLRLWDVPSWTPKPPLSVPWRVRDFVIAPDSKTVAVLPMDYHVALWNVTGDNQKHLLRTVTRVLSAPSFSQDGSLLATCEGLGRSTVWDAKAGKLLKVLAGPKASPILGRGALSPDGTMFTESLANGGLRVWDVNGEAPRADLNQKGPPIPDSRGVLYTKDGKTLIAAMDGIIYVWDVDKALAGAPGK